MEWTEGARGKEERAKLGVTFIMGERPYLQRGIILSSVQHIIQASKFSSNLLRMKD